MTTHRQRDDRDQSARSAGREARRRRYRQGAWAENLAACVLSFKGYRILARRFRAASGEIDLIAKRGHRLVFIEVKQRRSLAQAEASISNKQRQRIRKAADVWLARYPPDLKTDICFDVVFVMPWHWPRHIENAL